MKYSHFFGKKSSRIVLGTAYFGDGITEDRAFELMDKFRELGGTHIDTARLYAEGRAEEIVGRWIRERDARDMMVSTKGAYYDADLMEKPRLTESEILSDVHASLKALGTDCIDFYWLHKDDENTQVSSVIPIMNKLTEEGYIKAFGASNWSSRRIREANEFARANGLLGFAAAQLRFNPAYCLGERGGLVGMDPKEFAFYKTSGMPVVAYSSQAKGFFSKMAEGGADLLSEKAKKRYLCEENLRRLEVLKRLSHKYSCSIAAVICAAFSSFEVPEVFAIIGSQRVEQLADSMSGHMIELTKQEIEDVFALDIL